MELLEEIDDKMSKNADRFTKLQEELKNLFLVICQRFIMVLSENTTETKEVGKEGLSLNNPYWHSYVTQRLEEFMLRYHTELFKMTPTLEQLLFKPDLPNNLYQLFQNFKGLRA